jgi:hypothetical protein
LAADGWWDDPVRVVVYERGESIEIVNNNTQAGNVLIAHWPPRRGTKHREARQAVFDALKTAGDVMSTAKARKAFADAAREARILVTDN